MDNTHEIELSALRPLVSELRHSLAIERHHTMKLVAENSALRSEIAHLRRSSDTTTIIKAKDD